MDTDRATVRDAALSTLARLPINAEEPDFLEDDDAAHEIGPRFTNTRDPAHSEAASRELVELHDSTTMGFYRKAEAMLLALRDGQGDSTEYARQFLRLAIAGYEHVMMRGLDAAENYLGRKVPNEEMDALYERHRASGR